jgi:hypothetical protein
MKNRFQIFAACLISLAFAAPPAQTQSLGPTANELIFAPKPDTGDDLATGELVPEDFSEVGSIQMPEIMQSAEEKMKLIRAAKNLTTAQKSAMEKKFADLESGFQTVWKRLEINYQDRIQLPQEYSRSMANLKYELDQLHAKPVDETNKDEYDKYYEKESFLHHRIADLHAELPMQLRALNKIIKTQRAEVEAWAKGPLPANFISEADRLLVKHRKKCYSSRIH